MTYSIETYRHAHLESCAELVRKTWNIHRDFRDMKCQDSVYIAYVRNCIDFSEFSEVVVDDLGHVQGILFGSREKRTSAERFRLLQRRLGTSFWIGFRYLCGDFGRRRKALAEFRKQRQIDALGESDSDLFDGEVNLLIVGRELRGQKYGFTLMNRYLDFCKSHRMKRIFLWTDPDCTYSFYERYGFSLFKSIDTKALIGPNAGIDRIMVYTLQVPETAGAGAIAAESL